ncbi:MAG: cytosolic protein [Vicinamibacteria bacterium]|nr:cytosolic protein [Vicinamibacteria bacterium]
MSVRCSNVKINTERCNCSYEPCSRKGNCCECLRYHLRARELPACCFPKDAEKTYDRSFRHFARLVTSGRI